MGGPVIRVMRFPTATRRDPAVEAWLRAHDDELGAIARQWFEVLRACGDDVRELLHDGQPTACVGDAAFGYVDAFTAHVNVGFYGGSALDDPAGLLVGTGKFMRHATLRPGAPVDAAALRDLIQRAYLDMKRSAAGPGRGARLGILYPGDRAMRERSDPDESRFAALFSALGAAGVAAEPVVYHDDFVDEVRAQLLRLAGVLAWHNPVEGGRTRAVLDALLRDVAEQGVFVSAHPETILRLGTKDVLVAVRDLPFGGDAWRVGSLDEVRGAVMARLADGPRVLKQHRGHSGIGVWRIEMLDGDRFLLRHAQRGASETVLDLDGALRCLAPYFENGGHMVDQAWQPRLVEGMVRAYLVGDRLAGFGHQAVNALYPATAGAAAPLPGPRLYSGPDDPRFQVLRDRLERDWVRMLRAATGVAREALPLLWDADFLPGEKQADGDSYVLCEVNVSSVSPFPESSIAPLVAAVRHRLGLDVAGP